MSFAAKFRLLGSVPLAALVASCGSVNREAAEELIGTPAERQAAALRNVCRGWPMEDAVPYDPQSTPNRLRPAPYGSPADRMAEVILWSPPTDYPHYAESQIGPAELVLCARTRRMEALDTCEYGGDGSVSSPASADAQSFTVQYASAITTFEMRRADNAEVISTFEVQNEPPGPCEPAFAVLPGEVIEDFWLTGDVKVTPKLAAWLDRFVGPSDPSE